MRTGVAPGDLGKKCEMQCPLLVDGWHAHETRHGKRQISHTRGDDRIRIGWGECTGILRFLAGVHQNENATLPPCVL